MTITATILAIQARARALAPVITYAPDELPEDLNPETQLPAVITDPMEGNTRQGTHGDDLLFEVRTYRLKLCAAPVELNGSYVTGAVRTLARTCLDALLADLRSNSQLTSTAEILLSDADGMRDMGVLPHPVTENAVVHRGQTYAGSYIYLKVQEWHE